MRARLSLLSLLPLLLIAACGDDDDASASTATTRPASPTTTSPPQRPGIDVTFEVALPAGTYREPVCDGPACVFPFTSSGKTFTGDLVGTAVGAGGGGQHPDGGLSGAEYSVFTGEVVGCGTGTFAYIDIASGTERSRLEGTWQIVEGSGTGELARISGAGTSETVTRADVTGSATASGTVECD